MIYQNYDLSSNYFLVHNDETKIVYDIHTLKNSKLAQQIYFSPSSCPIINRNNSNDGSCFEDYMIPTSAYTVAVTDVKIKIEKIPATESLTTYIDSVYFDIQNQLIKIYKQHTEVTLCYSGGIDSMVLLSFIINLNLLSRTNIIFFKNSVTNSIEKPLVLDLLCVLKSKANNVEILNITFDDVADSFNYESFEQLLCYATSSILRRTKNNAFIFGWHGNQILLHKNIFIDEILLTSPSQLERCKELIHSDNKFYTQSLKKYNFDEHKISLAQRYMLMKPWDKLNGINQNSVYSPIASDYTFQLLRRLDYSDIDVNVIIEASVAKEIIQRNVGNSLSMYYDIEDVTDGDVLLPCNIPLELIDINKLVIPDTLNHDPHGLTYITNEIQLAHKNQFIPLNSLVVIKALQWIDRL